MTDTAVLVERARHQARVERTMFGFKAGELYDALADALENPAVALADANTNPASSDLSSLRKGAEVAVDEIVTRIYRRFKDWSERKFSADDVTWCEVKADVLGIIALVSGSREDGA